MKDLMALEQSDSLSYLIDTDFRKRILSFVKNPSRQIELDLSLSNILKNDDLNVLKMLTLSIFHTVKILQM